MKKILLAVIGMIAFASLSFAQTNYPFDVKISGNGKTPVILIPGFACSGEVWNGTLKLLEPAFKCYTLTMHGFAGAKADSAPDIKMWISSIDSYIKNNHLQKPVIIGHSIGGVMAESLAAGYPGDISKIVVVDALPCLFALGDSNYKSYEHPNCSFMANFYKSMDSVRFRAMQNISMRGLMKDSTMLDTAVLWSVLSDRNTLGQVFCQFRNIDMRNKLSQITCPALVLLEPSFKGEKGITEQYSGLKTGQIDYANKGLHFIMYDDKEWYLNELKKFLKL
jgi:pimeloyl-ACP methyl ester carboxylesterase